MQTIGVYIIAKNEEESIANAILSLKPLCSQIVLVDTGSSDTTPVIASRMGCEVFYHKWNNDFSDARNNALQYMRTDWVIALDADEEFEVDSFAPYLQILNDESIGGIKVIIKNLVENESSSSVTIHSYTRIFRVHPAIRYSGIIHEQINQSILDENLRIVESNAEILHHGYSRKQESRSERNRTLIEKELDANQGDEWLKYHLAETEFSANNIGKAKELFEQTVNSTMISLEQKQKALLRLAQIALKENNYRELYSHLQFESNDVNIEGFRKYIFAVALMMESKFEQAALMLNSPEVSKSLMVDKNSLEDARQVLVKLKI